MKFNEPLGMPQGTVRAIIAIMIIGAAIACVFLPVDGSDKAFIWSMAGVAFGYYFGTRQAETAITPRSESDILPPVGFISGPPVDDSEGTILPGNLLNNEEDITHGKST